MTENETILEFQGENRFLSNFWPVEVEYGGHVWPTAEHAYVFAKLGRDDLKDEILACTTPAKVKRLGREYPVRSGWGKLRVGAMSRILEAKFANPELRQKLLDTHPRELEEGNSWGDDFWGVDKWTREGKNMLGKLLMRVRDDIRCDSGVPFVDVKDWLNGCQYRKPQSDFPKKDFDGVDAEKEIREAMKFDPKKILGEDH